MKGRVREVTRNDRMQDVVLDALRNGWDAEKTPGNHIKFTHPMVDQPVFGPSSPSDYRSAKNTAAILESKLRQAYADTDADIEAAREADRRTESMGAEGVIPCQACFGQGRERGFMSAEALVVHMRKEHPAPELTSEPEPQTIHVPDQQPSENDVFTPTGTLPSLREVEAFLEENAGREVTIDDIVVAVVPRDTREARKTIGNRLVSIGKRNDSRLRHPARGVYLYLEEGVEEGTAPEPEVPEPAEVPAPAPPRAVSNGVLYERVAETKDGRVIVKDDQGKVWFATFEEL